MITRNIEGTFLTGAPCTGRTDPVEARQVSALHEPRQQQERKPGRIHTEEVTGSIPVSPTVKTPGHRLNEPDVTRGFVVPRGVPGAFLEHRSFRSDGRSAIVLVVEGLENALAVVGPPGVEAQRRRGPLVAQDPLHHVRRDAVVDEPALFPA
ncbi:hypothetical protein [Pseudonocardia alni]|uniref:Uncharacterized protein n=1 Tax=Pseudonocardia alni TaxID=33907 RepID=A0A852WGV7_PSEA5|nr:hypothetical protein [Pseudonocardia antarctica]NYG04806.1 hypothetical protein [Pseudonocardia antarctica]